MILIFTQKQTPRNLYIFKHIFKRMLGLEVSFTSLIEEFLAFEGPKLSYGKQPLGNEVFFQKHGLLEQHGVESVDIKVKEWGASSCFFSVSDKSALPFDIFSAAFYLLSRYEEYLPHRKDHLGRYAAKESLGYKHQFLQTPVVDQWVQSLKLVLQASFPDLKFPKRQPDVHVVVNAPFPFAYKNKGAFRVFLGVARDILKGRFSRIFERIQVLLGLKRDPFDTFNWLIRASGGKENRVTVFFLLGDAMDYYDGMNTRRLNFKLLIKYVADYKNIGLMFSYTALKNERLLKKEQARLADIINRPILYSKNAVQLIDLPNIYRELIVLEVQKDFTMSYHNKPGFRAGTCTPFLFYDLDYEVRTPLIVHPVATTSTALQGRSEKEIQAVIRELRERVANVDGLFTMQFSNTDFNQNEHGNVWRSIYSEILKK